MQLNPRWQLVLAWALFALWFGLSAVREATSPISRHRVVLISSLASLCAVLLASFAPSLASNDPSLIPSIRFGLMRRDADGRYQVYKATTQIPLVTSDPQFRFGFDVEHSQAGQYVGYLVLHVPSKSQRAATTFEGNKPLEHMRDPDGRSVTTDKVHYERFWGADLSFEDSDIVGKYSVDIFVDDVLARRIEFTVVSAGE